MIRPFVLSCLIRLDAAFPLLPVMVIRRPLADEHGL